MCTVLGLSLKLRATSVTVHRGISLRPPVGIVTAMGVPSKSQFRIRSIFSFVYIPCKRRAWPRLSVGRAPSAVFIDVEDFPGAISPSGDYKVTEKRVG